MNILELAKRNQQKAWEIIEDTRIVRIWEGIGAKLNIRIYYIQQKRV